MYRNYDGQPAGSWKNSWVPEFLGRLHPSKKAAPQSPNPMAKLIYVPMQTNHRVS